MNPAAVTYLWRLEGDINKYLPSPCIECHVVVQERVRPRDDHHRWLWRYHPPGFWMLGYSTTKTECVSTDATTTTYNRQMVGGFVGKITTSGTFWQINWNQIVGIYLFALICCCIYSSTWKHIVWPPENINICPAGVVGVVRRVSIYSGVYEYDCCMYRLVFAPYLVADSSSSSSTGPLHRKHRNPPVDF